MNTNHTSKKNLRSLLAASSALAVLLITGAAFAEGERGHRYRAPADICAEGRVRVTPGMSTHTMSTMARGEIPCDAVGGRHCAGYVSVEPICLRVRRATTVDIEVTRSRRDSVLVLTGPGGTFADDDGGRGNRSRLTRYLTPGRYLLYVGTYRHGGRGSMTIAIRDADRHRRTRYYHPTRPDYRGHGRGYVEPPRHASGSGNRDDRGHDRDRDRDRDDDRGRDRDRDRGRHDDDDSSRDRDRGRHDDDDSSRDRDRGRHDDDDSGRGGGRGRR